MTSGGEQIISGRHKAPVRAFLQGAQRVHKASMVKQILFFFFPPPFTGEEN
jgi:hypothetical protein